MPYAELLFFMMALSAFLGLLVSLVVVVFNQQQPHASRLLALTLFSMAWFTLVSALLLNHAIFQFPHLFRSSAPVQYLIAPCAYLYLRAVVRQETRFGRYDWLHFVPAALHMLELLPFYAMGTAEKTRYLQVLLTDLQSVVKQQEGWLPAYYHITLKCIQGSIYFVFQWRLLSRFKQQLSGQQREQNQVLLNWLTLFTLLNGLLYLPLLGLLLLPLSADVNTLLGLFMLGSYLIACATLLLFNPQVLYGLTNVVSPEPPVPAATEEDITRGYTLSTEKRRVYRTLIEEHMMCQQPYLQNGYSIRHLCEKVQLPQHQVSAVINQEFGMNFSDFVNQYRVEYIKQKLEEPQWRRMTLEGIALEAGFTNRITFFRAFTKLTGTSPSTYLAQLNGKQ
ncbi:AraC family transcriptional regulator [Spirosoma pulveris]